MRAAIAGNPWFPKPADLRLSIADELREHHRCQDAARYPRLPPPPPIEPPTPEEIAEVERLLAPIKARFGERRRAIPSDIDWSGLLAELPPHRLVDEDDPAVAEWLGKTA